MSKIKKTPHAPSCKCEWCFDELQSALAECEKELGTHKCLYEAASNEASTQFRFYAEEVDKNKRLKSDLENCEKERAINANALVAKCEIIDEMVVVCDKLLEAYCNMAQMINSQCQFMGDQLTQHTEQALKKAKGEK